MALSIAPISQVCTLSRFGMNSPNAHRLLQFYEQAFGAQVADRARHRAQRDASSARIQGSVECTRFTLGESSIEIDEYDFPGHSYPRELSPYDVRFQHLGIVVTDMRRAMERLSQTRGWTAISTNGPQTLPANTGGVTAFKFQDPDGHPLEFLQFAASRIPAHWLKPARFGVHLGIDHSALSVSDAARSVEFYESLSLVQSGRTLNQGVEQEYLDGVPHPYVDVISLAPPTPTPHVELLHYRTESRVWHETMCRNDTAATRLIFTACDEATGDGNRITQDPDGHFLQFNLGVGT